VVDDLLELLLRELLGHELLEHLELVLLRVGLLLTPGRLVRVGGLRPALALALQHLELLLLGERTLQVLLRRAQAGGAPACDVATVAVASEPRLLELVLDAGDQVHANPGRLPPPRTCQCRWSTVCPPPGPTLTITR